MCIEPVYRKHYCKSPSLQIALHHRFHPRQVLYSTVAGPKRLNSWLKTCHLLLFLSSGVPGICPLECWGWWILSWSLRLQACNSWHLQWKRPRSGGLLQQHFSPALPSPPRRCASSPRVDGAVILAETYYNSSGQEVQFKSWNLIPGIWKRLKSRTAAQTWG